MVGFARHLSAVLVAIALVAAQVMPAWAGCHAQRHAAAAIATIDFVTTGAAGHHGLSHTPDIKADVSLADQTQPSQGDTCLGNCGCACGLSGAFVLATTAAINVPRIVALTPEFASLDLPLGNRPDGPRRPPRTTA